MVRFDPLSSQPPKIRAQRRGQRVNSRVPVILEWKDAEGRFVREGAFTRVIGPYGCLVVLPKHLEKDQHLTLVNTSQDRSNEARVAWNGKHVGEGWELGIELKQPPMDFWGLEL